MKQIIHRHECRSEDEYDAELVVLEDGQMVIYSGDGDEIWINASAAIEIADAILAHAKDPTPPEETENG